MLRPIPWITICLAVAVASGAPASAGGGGFGPKVYVAPDDVTPWQRSDSTDLFRDRPGDLRQDRQERTRERQRALEYRLDRLQSRVGPEPELDRWVGPRPEFDPVPRRAGPDPGRAILRRSTERDLRATDQELRSLRTQAPNADAVPLLEQQLDRLSRPTGLGE